MLIKQVKERKQKLLQTNPNAEGNIPVELVTASASGVDPHISVEAARWQAKRVARARAIALEKIHALIDEQAQGRQWLVFGQPRVNVLLLNLALDRMGNER